MSDKAVPFFNPSDIVSLGGNWVVQSHSPTDSQERAQGLAANGDEAASKLYDGKTTGSVVLECHAETGNLVLPNVGSVGGGYHIDNWSLAYNPTGFPQLTLNYHQHDDNSHVDGELNEFAPTLTCPAQFGCPTSLGFSTVDTDVGIRGLTYTLGCTHQDEPDSVGDHLAGENRDGVETLAVEFTKVPSAVTAPSGWDELNNGENHSNTTAETATYNWTNHVAREV